jgi:2,3-bisphosphoglycerate-independent phosphoglycerate mutase
MSLIFIFLDGVGLAPAGPDNPLTDADTPALRALLGGPLTIEQANLSRRERRESREQASPGYSSVPAVISVAQIGRWSGDLLLKAIDATLGVPGLPQSGTGQTALLAGMNAAELHGRHQPHFPPVALRSLLAERNVLRRVVERGGRATFANAFGPRYWEAVASRRIRRSASVIAAEGAGLRFRDMDDLRAGRAMAWDVTGAALREREPAAGLPLITPQEAGVNLARLADDHDLVFYESFLPDLAGHGRLATNEQTANKEQSTTNKEENDDTQPPGGYPTRNTPAVGHPSIGQQIDLVMNLLDGLLGGALAALRPQDSLLITSDHGNVESRAAPAHTRNPVPLLVAGPAARAFVRVESIADVAGALMGAVEKTAFV